MDSIFIA